MKCFGFVTLIAGTMLLMMTCIGHYTDLGNYESAPPRQWERFNPHLVETLGSYQQLTKTITGQLPVKSSDREVMDALYNAVVERFTHMKATHNFSGNWVLYLAGKVHPAFSHIYDPELLVGKGYSLLCDQSSYLLLRLAMDHGIRARHVGLEGHVVMEAWYDSDWHLYDPDLEVVPVDAAGKILSVEQLALNQELLEKYYGPHDAIEIVRSRENNTYVSYPEGARFEWKTNMLAYFEQAMEVLKFVVPFLFAVFGGAVALRTKYHS